MPRSRVDYQGMRCEEVRLALSALLDEEPLDESLGIDERDTRTHLAHCAGCQGWYAAAVRVTRAARVRPAEPVPDLTERILAAVHADPAIKAAARRGVPDKPRKTAPAPVLASHRRILRIAIAATAVAQLILAVMLLLDSLGVGGVTAAHVSRERAAFDVAVAVGFLLAARYPERARAFVPVAVVLALGLAVTSGIDVANATTTVANETSHLVTALQAALLWALGRNETSDRGTPTTHIS